MKKNVCIVEDDNDIRDLISVILNDERYDVSTCSTAKEFFDLLTRLKPDVIVFDIMLPDGNGMDLCRSLKGANNTANIPVLLMSAHSRIEEAMGEPCAVGFISKPFDIDVFKNKVESYLLI